MKRKLHTKVDSWNICDESGVALSDYVMKFDSSTQKYFIMDDRDCSIFNIKTLEFDSFRNILNWENEHLFTFQDEGLTVFSDFLCKEEAEKKVSPL